MASQKQRREKALRERMNVCVVDEKLFLPTDCKVPQCKHGPCLLFSDANRNYWFACAVFRSPKRCNFRAEINSTTREIQKYKTVKQISSLPLDEYGRLREQFEKLRKMNVPIYWCQQSGYVAGTEHGHCHLQGPFREWAEPLELLEPRTDDLGEAQYYFSPETIELVKDVLPSGASVLSIGVPTLYEKIRQKGNNAFLLDFDDRLALFHSPHEFARFSMLNCHFFIPESREHLLEFFHKSSRLVCICDPPFGVHVSALMRTITTLRNMFVEAKRPTEVRDFNVILFLPYFVGKHLRNSDLSMVDYRVTYSNHRDFSKPNKSIVRIFTDLPNKSFKLSAADYHYCDECDRYVANENRHCFKCGECTSKDGSPYQHCDKCGKCVRKKYRHCRKCSFCHLKERCKLK